MNMESLNTEKKSRTMLVTGANADLGMAFLRHFLQSGDTLVAQGFGDMTPVQQLAKERGATCKVFSVDFSSLAAIEEFVTELKALNLVFTHFLHLPALRVVNTKFAKFDFARYQADLHVQLDSALLIAQALLPTMAKTGYGRTAFVLTSYILGVPPKNTAAYVVVKSALGGLVKSLSAEYAGTGVTVNAVLPSMMETKFLEDTSNLIVEAEAKRNPAGRNATTADVVPALAYLLSEEAAFTTGVFLPVTGGSAGA